MYFTYYNVYLYLLRPRSLKNIPVVSSWNNYPVVWISMSRISLSWISLLWTSLNWMSLTVCILCFLVMISV